MSDTAALEPDVTVDDGFVPLRVRRVLHDTDDSVVVEFDSAPRPMQFAHGQHLTLRRRFDGVEVRRSYSICSPAPSGPLRVAIKHVPGGVFSNWATNQLGPGDEIDVLPPAGHFTHDLDPARAHRYALLAAGSGITPVFSIAATILAHEPRSTIDLLYVNRTSLSTMLLDDLHELRDRYISRLRINFAFTREDSGGELLSGRPDRGRLDALIDAGFLPSDADHAFLCGPIDLITEAEAALVTAGMTSDRIHREIFTTNQPGQVRTTPPDIVDQAVVATGRATLHGRTSTFDLFDGDTVLDAVQRVRPDAPFSCRAGVCSTCQAICTNGEVEMAVNYGLTADEVARGYVLTCQSRPTTSELTVDFDA